MYYRRKILLALLSELGGSISKLSLQKLLFLFSQSQKTAAYNFIPYKFGCYSYQASADMSTLGKYGFINETEKYYQLNKSTRKENYFSQLTEDDQSLLNKIMESFGRIRTSDLITHVYREYPYYAINSTIAKEHLTAKEFEKVIRSRPYSNETTLFTIGYEGISVEEYFNKLIQNDVKVLIDVRNFPRSMKFGFSKNQLKKICEGLGIVYIHLPRLGIESNFRKNLENQEDYDKLFQLYKSTTLQTNKTDQQAIIDLVKKYKRAALTCFESDIHCCHRLHLSYSILRKLNMSLQITHL